MCKGKLGGGGVIGVKWHIDLKNQEMIKQVLPDSAVEICEPLRVEINILNCLWCNQEDYVYNGVARSYVQGCVESRRVYRERKMCGDN